MSAGPPVKPTSPPALRVGALPILGGEGTATWTKNRFDQLQNTISSLTAAAVSNAKQVPAPLQDGMIRLARYPWWPVSGQSADAWVYYDACGAIWRLLSTAPTSTH